MPEALLHSEFWRKSIIPAVLNPAILLRYSVDEIVLFLAPKPKTYIERRG